MTPRILLIAGGSGSGKSLLAEYIAHTLFPGSTALVRHDMYYYGASHFTDSSQINFDTPEALENSLLARHLVELKAGKPVDIPVYDYTTHERTGATQHIEPQSLIIVEGLFTLSAPEVRAEADLSIFVDADDDVRIARRILRNAARNARADHDDLRYYFDYVKPGYDRHTAPQRREADIILYNNDPTPDAMYSHITRILALFSPLTHA